MNILYYPVLKWKAGEKIALSNLGEVLKSIVPIIEVVDIVEPTIFFNDVSKYYSGCYFFSLVDSEFDSEDIVEYSQYAFDHGIQAYPVIYQEFFEDVIQQLKNKVLAIKLDVPGPMEDTNLTTNITNIIDKCIDAESTFLILDAAQVLTEKDKRQTYKNLTDILDANIDMASKITHCIITITSFPSKLDVPSGGDESFPRYDFQIFERIWEQHSSGRWHGKLGYSDYGVTKFTDTDIDFSMLQYGVLPKAKYTGRDNYFVLKGSKDRIKNIYTRSYKDIAADIIHAPYYCGQSFSFGDRMIYDKATNAKTGPGGAKDWVAYCANHHIVEIVSELSKIAEP